jgi:hypothetical protein
MVFETHWVYATREFSHKFIKNSVLVKVANAGFAKAFKYDLL